MLSCLSLAFQMLSLIKLPTKKPVLKSHTARHITCYNHSQKEAFDLRYITGGHTEKILL